MFLVLSLLPIHAAHNSDMKRQQHEFKQLYNSYVKLPAFISFQYFIPSNYNYHAISVYTAEPQNANMYSTESQQQPDNALHIFAPTSLMKLFM
jgi:hypothetical protein